jgi:arginine/serine-rich splicing factor 12
LYIIEFASSQEANTARMLDGTKILEVPLKITSPIQKDILPPSQTMQTQAATTTTTYASNSPAGSITPTPPARESKEDEIARTVYVGNISTNTPPSKIVEFFSICGPVAFVRMAGDDHQTTRFAFIEFLDLAGAQAAMGLTGQMLDSRPVKVNRSKNAIVKPPVKLSNEEQHALQQAIRALGKKICSARGYDYDEYARSQRHHRKRHRSQERDYDDREYRHKRRK